MRTSGFVESPVSTIVVSFWIRSSSGWRNARGTAGEIQSDISSGVAVTSMGWKAVGLGVMELSSPEIWVDTGVARMPSSREQAVTSIALRPRATSMRNRRHCVLCVIIACIKFTSHLCDCIKLNEIIHHNQIGINYGSSTNYAPTSITCES